MAGRGGWTRAAADAESWHSSTLYGSTRLVLRTPEGQNTVAR